MRRTGLRGNPVVATTKFPWVACEYMVGQMGGAAGGDRDTVFGYQKNGKPVNRVMGNGFAISLPLADYRTLRDSNDLIDVNLDIIGRATECNRMIEEVTFASKIEGKHVKGSIPMVLPRLDRNWGNMSREKHSQYLRVFNLDKHAYEKFQKLLIQSEYPLGQLTEHLIQHHGNLLKELAIITDRRNGYKGKFVATQDSSETGGYHGDLTDLNNGGKRLATRSARTGSSEKSSPYLTRERSAPSANAYEQDWVESISATSTDVGTPLVKKYSSAKKLSGTTVEYSEHKLHLSDITKRLESFSPGKTSRQSMINQLLDIFEDNILESDTSDLSVTELEKLLELSLNEEIRGGVLQLHDYGTDIQLSEIIELYTEYKARFEEFSNDDSEDVVHKGILLNRDRYLPIDPWVSYKNQAIDSILKLRLTSLSLEKSLDIVVIPSVTLKKLIKVSVNIFDKAVIDQSKTILVPISIPQNAFVSHWIGMAITKRDNTLFFTYLDSENQKISPILKNALVIKLHTLFPNVKISFHQLQLEMQKYDNCGPELVENFIYYLTGTRTTQEAAVYLHSLLYEDSVLDPMVSGPQIEENHRLIAELSNQMSPLYNMPSSTGLLNDYDVVLTLRDASDNAQGGDVNDEVVFINQNTDSQNKEPNFELAAAMLSLRNSIEFIPVFSYFARSIVYPITKDIVPQRLANAKLPEFSPGVLYLGHVGSSYVGAVALNIAAPLTSAMKASSSYGVRLAFKEVVHNVASFDLTDDINMAGYCMMNVAFHFTPELMQLYYWMSVGQLIHGGKIVGTALQANSLTTIQRFTTSSLECYNTYKQVHKLAENVDSKTASIVPYLFDVVVAVSSFAVSYNPIFVIGNIVATDIATKTILKAIPTSVKRGVDIGLSCFGIAEDVSSTLSNIYNMYWQGTENAHSIKTYQSCHALLESFKTSWLQNMYDYSSSSRYYLNKVIEQLTIEKEQKFIESRNKLAEELGKGKAEVIFKYIAKPSLDIKYTLMKQVVEGFISNEEYNVILTKLNLSIDVSDVHYDLCINMDMDSKTIESDNQQTYNCYSKESGIINHLVIENGKLVGLDHLADLS